MLWELCQHINLLVNRKGNAACSGAASMLFYVIADVRKNGERQSPSSGFALARIPLVDHFPEIKVLHELAAVGGSQSFFYFAQKPFVIVHQALNGFDHKDIAGAAWVCGRADLVSFASKSGLRGTSIFPRLD